MKKFLLLLLLLLTSCRTHYIPLPSSHSRDSLVTRVNTRVDSIFIDRYHTEKLHRGSDPTCSYAGTDTILIHDSIYIERWRVNARVDTITVTHTDTISIAVPVEPPSRKSLALSERVRVLGKGCLLGGIGALILLFLLRIAKAVYLR